MQVQQPSDPWYHAFDQVYDAFHASLRRGARRLMGSRLRRRVTEEDVVQSVFRTFYRRDSNGECEFDHTGALRNYLWKIMTNKVRRYAERHSAQIRNVMCEVEMEDPHRRRIPDRQPGPDEWAVVRDEIRVLTRGFVPRDLKILQLRFDGHASSEIAAQVGCSRWTVRRVVEGFGVRLQQRSQDLISDDRR